MKNFIITLFLIFNSFMVHAQCTPNQIYADSLFDIWPDTIQNIPHVTQGVYYSTTLNIKTPSTLIEAADGDPSITQFDTLGQTYYVGDWPVDSMELIAVSGLPNGLAINCNEPGCMLLGDVLTCAEVSGTTNDPVGIYPITILVNVYTHGTITVAFIPIPVSTDLYSATGDYEEIVGYKVVIENTSSTASLIGPNDLFLFQNAPNPTKGNNVNINFYSPKSDNFNLSIVNLLGKVVYSQTVNSTIGINEIKINNILPDGVYHYSISNKEKTLTKRMIVSR